MKAKEHVRITIHHIHACARTPIHTHTHTHTKNPWEISWIDKVLETQGQTDIQTQQAGESLIASSWGKPREAAHRLSLKKGKWPGPEQFWLLPPTRTSNEICYIFIQMYHIAHTLVTNIYWCCPQSSRYSSIFKISHSIVFVHR